MFTTYLTQPDLFKKLNTLSKYPSILTYHSMGNRGCLTPDLSLPMPPLETTFYFTKKVRQEAPGLIRGEEWRKTLFKWS